MRTYWVLALVAACGRASFDRLVDASPSSDSADASPLDGSVDSSDAPPFQQCGDPVDTASGSIPTLSLGAQCWLGRNLSHGTTLTGAATPSNNGIVERYCYDDLGTNCASGGGLYEWDEAMAGMVGEGSQGICPTGWHIPSDTDWQALETFLGLTAQEIVMYGYRGTQASKLEPGGSSGFDAAFVGVRVDTGGYLFGITQTTFWSSTEGLAGANGVVRSLSQASAGIERYGYDKNNGFSVRCVMN